MKEHGDVLEERVIKGFKCLFLKNEIRYIEVLNKILSESDLEILAQIFQTAKIGELGEEKIRKEERRMTVDEIIEHLKFLRG